MNNDLISRSELKKALQEYKHTHYDDDHPDLEYEYIDIDDLNYVIDNATTVDLWQMRQEATENALKKAEVLASIERPQGEWGKWNVYEIRCPECLEYFNTDCYSKEELNKCPNCGADMRKGGAV